MNGIAMMADVWSRIDGPVTFLAVGVLALAAVVATVGVLADREHRIYWALPLSLIAIGLGSFLASIFLNGPYVWPFVWEILPELAALITFAGVPTTVLVALSTQSSRAFYAIRSLVPGETSAMSPQTS
ncbi:hypothetical protein IEU95_12050 [Hoyosella rhizosphaerae]|uniref:Uncharacterized protein n=1 Tax=Hoyosella rhizosphaerae TaxID=1755582 RepID=A0A916U9E5_9ACTN|nr:hypothetical protein [Hoyosella rhizosphaerae]MBN4927566.1 hypothetical protein [Hoyosella rhizosphaerae]GGC63455.1 hypothetical protein GCM10011410_14890 [Hoyosella rhizosphaerae]